MIGIFKVIGLCQILSTSVLAQTELIEAIPSRYFEDLDSDSFKTRDDTQGDLLAWGRINRSEAPALLIAQISLNEEPEVRARCLEVLRDLVVDEYLAKFEGFLGVSLAQDQQQHGVVIQTVYPNHAAEKAGLMAGDRIISLEEDLTAGGDFVAQFQSRIRAYKPGTSVPMKIIRAGREIHLTVVVGSMIPHGDLVRFAIAGSDFDSAVRAAKEAYFREWLRDRNQKNKVSTSSLR